MKNVFAATTKDNINRNATISNTEWVERLKISKSEQDAYNKDVQRLRWFVKLKGKASNSISVVEMQALLRSTHKIRRQMLSEKKDTELSLKVLEHQEIFHEEGVSFFIFFLNVFFLIFKFFYS